MTIGATEDAATGGETPPGSDHNLRTRVLASQPAWPELRPISGILSHLMADRRLTNSELRLRRLTAEELDSEPRGILEIFAEGEPADEDAPLARDDDEHERQ